MAAAQMYISQPYIHELGLKPDLVLIPSVVASPAFLEVVSNVVETLPLSFLPLYPALCLGAVSNLHTLHLPVR